MSCILPSPTLDITNQETQSKVKQLLSPYLFSTETCLKIKDIFKQQMELGISSNEADRKKSCLLMESTFMTRLPNGSEKGLFLSLDLGGTNFRVLTLNLTGNGGEGDTFDVQFFSVPASVRVGPSVELFDFLAQSISTAVKDLPKRGDPIPLAFSFSFPMVQQSVDSGFLVTWTKSFDLPDGVGKDAVSLLRDAIARRGDLNIKVVAILNDSTGTLLKGSYLDPDCGVGMILGSGFNCCYVEQVDAIHKLGPTQRETLAGAKYMAIDIECGAFGDNGCIDLVKTDVDQEVDAVSTFPKSFSFEKLFAGNFLGDVFRRIIVKLTRQGLVLGGKVTPQLDTMDAIASADLVRMETDGSSLKKLLQKLGYDGVCEDDCRILHYVEQVVSIRCATLASILLSCLIDRMGRPRTVVAIDGSLYKNHPRLHTMMTDVIGTLSPGQDFAIILSEDGSGKGAGLAAAVLTQP